MRFDQTNIRHDLKSENALNGSLFPDGTGQWLAVVSFVGDDPGYSIFETSTGAGWVTDIMEVENLTLVVLEMPR